MTNARATSPPAASGGPAAAGEAEDRRRLRAAMRDFARPDDRRAWALVLGDGALWLGFSLWSATTPQPWLQALLAPAIALMVVRLFVIGHDADHGAFVRSARVNRWIALVTLLPGLVSRAGWHFGHGLHHTYANSHGLDTTWCPMTPAQYAAAPAWRRWLERASRAPLGQGLHVAAGVVTVVFVTLARWAAGRTTPAMGRDALIVLAFMIAQPLLLVWIGAAAGVPALQVLAMTVVLPTLLWFTAGGFIVYVNHTDPEIAWYGAGRTGDWDGHAICLDHTTNIALPFGLHRLLHDVLEHVPHHVNTRIPCYRLRAARQAIEALYPGRLRTEVIGWRRYLQIVRTCQLYDLERQAWVPFAAVPPGRGRGRARGQGGGVQGGGVQGGGVQGGGVLDVAVAAP